MIGKVFLNESKLHGFVSAALFALALLVSLICFIAAVCLPISAGVGAAEVGFAVLNAFSYVGPLALLGAAVFQRRYGHYRMAGVRENAVFWGSLLAVCAWSAAFILAEMLAATALDAGFFLTNASLRNRIIQRAFLLSLIAHGAPRLLFCLSVAFSVGILYFTYDALSVLAKRTHGGIAVKIVYVFIGIAVCAVYQLFVAGMMYITAAWDAGTLLSPDSVLPLSYMLDRLYHDSVKDVHFMASALLHWVFYAGELLYIAAGVFLVKWLRRCDNEIGW
mgnify:CR=1 FL=1